MQSANQRRRCQLLSARRLALFLVIAIVLSFLVRLHYNNAVPSKSSTNDDLQGGKPYQGLAMANPRKKAMKNGSKAVEGAMAESPPSKVIQRSRAPKQKAISKTKLPKAAISEREESQRASSTARPKSIGGNTNNTSKTQSTNRKAVIRTYRFPKIQLTTTYYPLVFLQEMDPLPENAIFIMETSGRDYMSPKVLCSVESASLWHPNKTVILGTLAGSLVNTPILAQLQSDYKNIVPTRINVSKLFNKTVLKTWTHGEYLMRSPFRTEHISDILRGVILYLYGGIFLETDVIVLKALDGFTNAVGLGDNSSDILTTSTLVFEKGHPVWGTFLNETFDKYSASNLSANGPQRVTSVVRKLCGAAILKPGIDCKGLLQILPQDVFSYVTSAQWQDFYIRNDRERAKAVAANLTERSYVAHYWNSLSRGDRFEVRTTQPGARHAKLHCPTVTAVMGEYLWGFPDSGYNFHNS